MDRKEYDRYLDCFNGRDYDRVLEFWAPELSCTVGGEKLFASPEELKSFCGFLHDYVKEEILVEHFLSDSNKIFLEARVRITGKKDITQTILDESGFATLMPIDQGMVIEMPQVIHYHLRDGKFASASCLLSGPPTVCEDRSTRAS